MSAQDSKIAPWRIVNKTDNVIVSTAHIQVGILLVILFRKCWEKD